jgi:hypothetical protein
MRALSVLVMLVLTGCGLESLVGNMARQPFERPASKLHGELLLPAAKLVVSDADGKVIEPFLSKQADGKYEVRLPSAKYSNLVISAQAGNMVIRALVPAVGEESALELNVDARSTAEALIAEARLSAEQKSWKQVTPEAYLATRALIHEAFEVPGPTQSLLVIVTRLLAEAGDLSGSGLRFFAVPELRADYSTKVSALDPNWIENDRPDLDGDGRPEADSSKFDALLAEVAKLYRPAGCPDPNRIRVVFTVDYNEGRKNGNCGVSDRFKWAPDKPGKSMFFVGWLEKESPVQDPLVLTLLGNSTPNQIAMKDDGSGGDEVAADNVWTVYFDVPRGTRIGYKYTWGTRGAVWTGTEEWPGNNRILEAVDVSGDDLVYRRDVFADEASNKNKGNLNANGTGSIDWTTDLRGYGIEAREQKIDVDNDCVPDLWFLPKAIGPLTVACTQ